MKRALLLLLVLNLSFAAFAQVEKYSRIKITVNSLDLKTIASNGIAVDEGYYDYKEQAFITELSQRELDKVHSLGLPVEILIDDVSEWYVSRNAGIDIAEVTERARLAPSDYPVPVDFELGSCGGFYTIEQCYAELDYMAATYPELITIKAPVSNEITTYEDRPMYYVKISDNPNEDEGEPQVLYTGMHHAREGIGMQHLMYYMYYLLENYDNNQEVRDLVNNTEMFFIPILNVDGYARNIQTNPAGGGMWRKNRRDNGDGSYGIDVNRNYGFAWGYDNEGSSPYPWDDTFRGTEAFSEAETQMIKGFCESHNFKLALNYHSYSNLLLYAWGYIPEVSTDDAVFAEYSKNMTVDNHYIYGPACVTIYPTNGGSDDWMYGEQETKPKILAYTPECGNDNDGFWPSTSRIIPLCQENMIQSILAARYSGTYGKLMDQTPLIIPAKEYYAYFDVTRLGQTATNYKVHIEPLGDAFESVGDTIEINGLQVLDKVSDSIPFTLSSSIKSGDTIQFILVLNDGYITYRDTVQKYFGTPVHLFSDDLTTNENWSGNWALSTLFPWSAPTSMADSPLGNYGNNNNKSTQLLNEVTLTNASVAVLGFYARWYLEPGYDFVQVFISNDNGQTWSALEGRYTKNGTLNQAFGQPVYDDRSGWVREQINISNYADQPVKIKFTLRTDYGGNFDGYYFDDVTIDMIDRTVDAQDNELPADSYLSDGYPNPSSDKMHFKYNLKDNGTGKIILTDLSGRTLKIVNLDEVSGEVVIPTHDLSKGMYLCTLTINGKKSITKKIAVGY
ncbi:MAG TPA: M14 family zinc carboxypeptidase [Lentimicrobium sp.]|nr:M14 family zinc carboxypeptidase [Lentimicrobium sp.]